MKRSPAIFTAVILATLAGTGVPQSAQATEAREAIRLCDRNPKCSYNVRDNGSIDLTVNGNHISCPQEGPCVCEVCSPPALKAPPKVGTKLPNARVTDVLKLR